MKTSITASMLYDLVQCPHRVTMDLFEEFTKRESINPFVQLLWEKGNAFEQEVIEKLHVPFVNLRPFSDQEREQMTKGAMVRGNALIYGGRISADDLLGEPDFSGGCTRYAPPFHYEARPPSFQGGSMMQSYHFNIST